MIEWIGDWLALFMFLTLLVLIFTGTGERVAESVNGSASGAPRLHVEYALSDQQRPQVDAGDDQAVALPADASLDGTVSDDGLPDPPGAVTTSWSKASGPGTVTFGDASAVDTTASFSQSGVYVLRLVADDGELATSDTVTITVVDEGSQVLERRVSDNADDAEESASGSVSVTNGDLELVYDKGNQTVGVRFTDITVPSGVTITNAYVQFKADETNAGATNLVVRAHASGNAPTFTTASGGISSRPRTSAAVATAYSVSETLAGSVGGATGSATGATAVAGPDGADETTTVCAQIPTRAVAGRYRSRRRYCCSARGCLLLATHAGASSATDG